MTPENTDLSATAPDTSRGAVILLSGGLDSQVVLAIAGAGGFRAHALTLRYGQRHEAEIAAAGRVAEAAGCSRHDVMDIDLARFGGSALTGPDAVPKDRNEAEIGGGIPVTYVPARNTVFLALALARAETLGVRDIFIGVNALDYSGYPDCRPEYVAAFEALANLATKAGVEAAAGGGQGGGKGSGKGSGKGISLHAPLIDLTKAGIVKRGDELGVDFSLTLSCYDPVPKGTEKGEGADVLHCGRCDACQLRKKGFAEAGVDDPTAYAA